MKGQLAIYRDRRLGLPPGPYGGDDYMSNFRSLYRKLQKKVKRKNHRYRRGCPCGARDASLKIDGNDGFYEVPPGDYTRARRVLVSQCRACGRREEIFWSGVPG